MDNTVIRFYFCSQASVKFEYFFLLNIWRPLCIMVSTLDHCAAYNDRSSRSADPAD